MPLYDYLCEKCGKYTEELRTISDRDNCPECPECNTKTIKLITGNVNLNTGKGSRLPCWVSHLDEGPGQYISTKNNFVKSVKTRLNTSWFIREITR